jgi:hypothetical protein
MARSVGHRTSAWPDDVVPIAVEVVPVDLQLAKVFGRDPKK